MLSTPAASASVPTTPPAASAFQVPGPDQAGPNRRVQTPADGLLPTAVATPTPELAAGSEATSSSLTELQANPQVDPPPVSQPSTGSAQAYGLAYTGAPTTLLAGPAAAMIAAGAGLSVAMRRRTDEAGPEE